MRRLTTVLALACLLAGTLGAVTIRRAAAEVDVASLDPEALFAALSESAMSDVRLPGSLRVDAAEVAGYGDTYPSVGNVGINWPDDGVYLNYFVFATLGSAAGAYVVATTGTASVDAPDAPELADSCRPSEATDAAGGPTETCFTLRANIIVAAFAGEEADAAPALLRAAVEHLDIVALRVADAGGADPGSSAAARSTAEAEVTTGVDDGSVATLDPTALLQALVSSEMSDVDLPGFLKSEDATVERLPDGDETGTNAVGGVTITWSGMDEGSEITLVVYPDEAAAGAAYGAEMTTVEAALGVVPSFQTGDGLDGFCDVSSMASADDAETTTCRLLSGVVVVAGADGSQFGDASGLARAGVLHLAYVSRAVVEGDAGATGTPVVEAVDRTDARSLLDALETAEIGPEVELPAYLPAEDAAVNGLGPAYLEGGALGAVAIVWGSDDPDRQVDALIYLYVYETDSAAQAAYGADESAEDEARTFSVDAATASGTVEGTCVPVDEDGDGTGDYDLCAALSGTALVVAADVTEANDGEALAAAGVEHVESVRAG